MKRSNVLAAMLCIVLALAAGGCTSDTQAEEPAATQTQDSQPATEQDVESSTAEQGEWAEAAPVLPGDDALLAAAEQSLYPIYRPTVLPTDFSYLEDESMINPNTTGIAYGNGNARLLIIQGSWDLGDVESVTLSEDAQWGATSASLLGKVPFAWQGPVYSQDAEAVFAHDLHDGASYAIMGVGVTREDLLAVAASMELIE